MKWPETFSISDARKVQEQVREKVRIAPFRGMPGSIAGVDAAFSDDAVYAAACLFRFPGLELLEEAYAVRRLSVPYVPGFLALREGTAIITAIGKLGTRPDVLLVDGQGLAHPRGAGIASHIGVMLNIPAIGCAKKRLIGEFGQPGSRKGEWSPLRYEGGIVGAVLRTRDGVNPLFVSPGHRVDLKSAVRIVLACTGKYRIPEPIRCADMLSKKLKSLQPRRR